MWGAVHMAAAVEKPWLANWLEHFLIQMGVDKVPLPFYELHFWHCTVEAFTGQRALTIDPAL